MLRQLFNRNIALPSDHGTWAFFLSPLIIGLVAGGTWRATSSYLAIAALSGFLLRQPITSLVKIAARRRSRQHLTASIVWSCVYLAIALAHLLGLFLRGYGFVLVLAVPGAIVFGWYLLLIARRGERGQKIVEIVGAGVLALSAPAAYWIGIEAYDFRGWLLWFLCWIFSTMSIVHVYARLDQRRTTGESRRLLRRPAQGALFVNSILLAMAVATASLAHRPLLLPLPFLLQWAESALAAFATEPPGRPTAIGMRQLVVSSLFTVAFIAVWG